jgi:pSer/pThr/pTyr-binding forkhead associated (FHA) protein
MQQERPAPGPKPGPAGGGAKPAARKTLYVVNSAGDMHKIEKDTFIIGRSRTCDLVIPSSKVSRQHSGICRENGEYYIEDLGSANGVWRDGVKIQKEKIKDGDEFMISEEVLKFIFR